MIAYLIQIPAKQAFSLQLALELRDQDISQVVAIKQALANRIERKELSKIANAEIKKFHMNLHSKAVTIEMLNKVRFKLKNNYIILDGTQIRKKLKMSNCIKTGEEVYADRSDKPLSARRKWKEACQHIITKI